MHSVPAGISRRVRFDFLTCSSDSDRTVAPADAAASMTFGAGYDPAVTNPSICPFLSAGTALDNSTSANFTLPSRPNILRYFAPSFAPNDPLPRRIALPSMPAKSLTPEFLDITKCIVSEGIGNNALTSSNRGFDLSLNIAFPSRANFISTGGVVNT